MQEETRIILVLGFDAPYIRDFTVLYFLKEILDTSDLSDMLCRIFPPAVTVIDSDIPICMLMHYGNFWFQLFYVIVILLFMVVIMLTNLDLIVSMVSC